MTPQAWPLAPTARLLCAGQSGSEFGNSARDPAAGRQNGIGHTRWATHGRPSEENAHPHQAGPVAIMHNGIVENYVELRDALVARDRLTSQTDTEVIAHLVEEKVRTA